VPNVVTIARDSGTLWLGYIREFDQYRAILEWAIESRDAGELQHLPQDLQALIFQPFLIPNSRSDCVACDSDSVKASAPK
jgi:hypothetical protein